MTRKTRVRLKRANIVAFIVPAALLAGAYISQYGFGLYPCEMCWWQRYAHFAALVPAALAFAVDGEARRWLVRLAALCIAVAAGLGAWHAGIEYGWWQGVTSCATTVEDGGDTLEAILNAPTIRCDVTPWSLFGISLAGYNFLISGAAAVAILILAKQKRPKGVIKA